MDTLLPMAGIHACKHTCIYDVRAYAYTDRLYTYAYITCVCLYVWINMSIHMYILCNRFIGHHLVDRFSHCCHPKKSKYSFVLLLKYSLCCHAGDLNTYKHFQLRPNFQTFQNLSGEFQCECWLRVGNRGYLVNPVCYWPSKSKQVRWGKLHLIFNNNTVSRR